LKHIKTNVSQIQLKSAEQGDTGHGIQEAEAAGSQVQSQCELHSKILSQKKNS
jgi:hypothetical protein